MKNCMRKHAATFYFDGLSYLPLKIMFCSIRASIIKRNQLQFAYSATTEILICLTIER